MVDISTKSVSQGDNDQKKQKNPSSDAKRTKGSGCNKNNKLVDPLINPVLTSGKQLRKEKYADLAVQGTNNSSIASKRSAESVYFSKFSHINRHIETGDLIEYFKFFVPKVNNRSPSMNRGYWFRLHGIRTRLDSIMEYRNKFHPNKKIAIINLGCGFDPLAFQLLDRKNKSSENYWDNCVFLDSDYSDLLMKKIEIIENNKELTEIVGTNQDKVKREKKDHFTAQAYLVRPCDLNNTESYSKLLLNSQDDLPFLYDDDCIKVFIAEVSLEYMKPQLADEIIRISSKLSDSHFLILEQLISEGPFEPFSKQMLKHFKKNDSPLLSVTTYQTIQSQVERFERLGFPYCNAGDMLQLWNTLPSETKSHIETIQPFDELEEFHLFGHHYLMAHATSDKEFSFQKPYLFEDTNTLKDIQVEPYETDVIMTTNETQINRSFGAAASFDKDNIFYFGGSTPYRLNELLKINVEQNEVTIVDKPKVIPPSRACHTFTKLNDGSNRFLLVAGRNAPHRAYKDAWLYDSANNLWEQCEDLPQTRFRHSTVTLASGDILVYGGKTEDANSSPFLLYDVANNKWNTVETNAAIPNLVSSSLDYNKKTNQITIVGGFDPVNHVLSDKMYIYEFNSSNNSLSKIKEMVHPIFLRYGSKLRYIDDFKVILVGGTSSGGVFNDKSTMVIVDTDSEDVKSVEIPSKIWQDENIMFIGFDLVWSEETHKLTIIGGGATCYAFGKVINSTLLLQL
ncbi:tRNA wybutosine-synthesizing protein 4 [Monosporozyma unispora]